MRARACVLSSTFTLLPASCVRETPENGRFCHERWLPACTPRRSMRGQSQGMASAAVRNVTTSTPELTGRLRAALRPENELTPECETLAASQIVYAATNIACRLAGALPGVPRWIVVLTCLTDLLRPRPRRNDSLPVCLWAVASSLPGSAPRLELHRRCMSAATARPTASCA